MNEIVEELRKWREARNMQNNEFVVEEQVAYMLDKCKEILLAKTDEHRAEEYCDIAIFAFNGISYTSENFFGIAVSNKRVRGVFHEMAYLLKATNDFDIVFSLNKVISYCELAVTELGYDFQKMMLEKIKVISIREQDPEQAKEWVLNGASGKWLKSSSQSKDTLYKPDFESCRICK